MKIYFRKPKTNDYYYYETKSIPEIGDVLTPWILNPHFESLGDLEVVSITKWEDKLIANCKTKEIVFGVPFKRWHIYAKKTENETYQS